MKNKKHKWTLGEIALAIGILLTPVAVIWSIIDLGTPKDFLSIIGVLVIQVITGCGGLAIGVLLFDKFFNYIEKEGRKQNENTKKTTKTERNHGS